MKLKTGGWLVSMLMATSWIAFAQNQQPSGAGDDVTAHIAMHEKMAAAHKDAAECLKEGKPVKECRSRFQAACQDSGAMMGCGMGKGMGMGRGPRHR